MDVDGRTQAYREAGDRETPLMMLLHGIGSGSGSWGYLMDHFKDRYRLIAWDAPGYNISTPLPEDKPGALGYAGRWQVSRHDRRPARRDDRPFFGYYDREASRDKICSGHCSGIQPRLWRSGIGIREQKLQHRLGVDLGPRWLKCDLETCFPIHRPQKLSRWLNGICERRRCWDMSRRRTPWRTDT